MNKKLIVACLLAGALVAWMIEHRTPTVPRPVAPVALSLRGKFITPRAAADAVALGAFCHELADCLELDGKRQTPRIKTGAQVEDVRIAALEGRFKGESVGSRQPHVRAAIHKYLDEVAGDSGGPLSSEGRAKWVRALRDISQACEDAVK